jgi:hypothetical protein
MNPIPATPTASTAPSRSPSPLPLAPCWMVVSLDGVERGRFNEISDSGAYGKARRLRDELAAEIANAEKAAATPAIKVARPAPQRPTYRKWFAPSPDLDARMDMGQEATRDPNFFSLCCALESEPF